MTSPPTVSIFELYQLNSGVHSDGLCQLAKKYGEIYALLPSAFLKTGLSQTYVVNSYLLAKELLGNESQKPPQNPLPKAVAGPLEFIRKYLTGDALITALDSEREA
ncbi:hypothetical protein FRC12_005907 [Ceratobasidium sp. 428]|nr:hypothetical protein FRC12_005907 [Ceratobasidium sp. 428]